MKQEALAYFTDTWMTLLGLAIFFIFFLVMLVRVYSVKKDYFLKMSKMPLEEASNE